MSLSRSSSKDSYENDSDSDNNSVKLGWIKLTLKLANWGFDNVTFVTRTDMPLESVIRQIHERIGYDSIIRLWKNSVTEANQIENFSLRLADVGIKGSTDSSEPKPVTIYYDYSKNHDGNALLLRTPRIDFRIPVQTP